MSDERTRRLERQAATGDLEAKAKLERARERAPCANGHEGPWGPVVRELTPMEERWGSPGLRFLTDPTHELCSRCGGTRMRIQIRTRLWDALPVLSPRSVIRLTDMP